MLLLAVATLLSGCSPIVRERTLPPSVRSVYIPMIKNRTAEPGLEERFTVAVQKEFLADGRLNVVREKEADAILDVTLLNFDRVPQSFDSDNFATSVSYELTTAFEIKENIPGRPAIGGRRKFNTAHFASTDTRVTSFEPESVWMERLAEMFARQMVLEVITGEYESTSFSPEALEAESMEPRSSL